MLRKVLLVVCLGVLLATMAVASAGCASGSGITSILTKVPDDTVQLTYVNVKTLRNDADLDDLYDAWKAKVDSRLEAHGISPDDVSAFASNEAAQKRFTLLTGKFDMDEIREDLEDLHFKEDEYKGVEVWEREMGWVADLDYQVALMGDLIIMGDQSGVESCIKVIKAGDASWLSKADINDVANRLPGGLYVLIGKQATGFSFGGLEAFGLSASKQDSGTLKVAGVAKFNDEGDAENAEGAYDDTMEMLFDSAEVTQEGAFLKLKAEMDIDDAEGLF